MGILSAFNASAQIGGAASERIVTVTSNKDTIFLIILDLLSFSIVLFKMI